MPEPKQDEDQQTQSGECSSSNKSKQGFKVECTINAVALLAFVLALIPNTVALYHFIYPVKLTGNPPDKVTFYTYEYPLPNERQVGILRVAIPLDFENLHPNKKLPIDKIEVRLTVGQRTVLLEWQKVVDTGPEPAKHKKLSWKFIEDAQPFFLDPQSRIRKEIAFSAMPGSVADPLANAMTAEDFIALAKKGVQITVDITISSGSHETKYSLIPTLRTRLAKYMEEKGWTVQDMRVVRRH